MVVQRNAQSADRDILSYIRNVHTGDRLRDMITDLANQYRAQLRIRFDNHNMIRFLYGKPAADSFLNLGQRKASASRR